MPNTSSDTMGIDNLNNTVSVIWDNALSERTLSTYSAGVKSFKTFLMLNNVCGDVRNLPEVTEDVFIHYIAYCFDTLHIKYSTIKLYLSGVRFEYLKMIVKCPLIGAGQLSCERIHAFLNAVKHIQGQTKRPRYPITASILNQMCSVLQNGFISQYTDSLLRAAFVTSFFGFLRCSEITSSQHGFDSSINVCLDDVTFQDSYVELHLKASKTDRYRRGISIKLFKNETNDLLCPYNALSMYLVLRNKAFPMQKANESPFFITESGNAMCRSFYVSNTKQVLARLGFNTSFYNGHSYRVGAASSAASCRLEDHLIRTLGRWSSDCYRTYIHTPDHVIQNAQAAILQGL